MLNSPWRVRLSSVARDHEGDGLEGVGELLHVGLELVEGGLGGGVLGACILQLDDGQGQAVDVEHDVEAPLRLPAAEGELVDGVVRIAGGVRGEEPDGGGLLLAVPVHVGDARVAVHEDLVEAVVLRDRVLGGRGEHLGRGLVQVLRRDGGVEGAQGAGERAVEDGVLPGGALTGAGRDGGPAEGLPAVLGQDLQGVLLPVLLVHADAGHGQTSSSTRFSASLTVMRPDMSWGSSSSRTAVRAVFSCSSWWFLVKSGETWAARRWASA